MHTSLSVHFSSISISITANLKITQIQSHNVHPPLHLHINSILHNPRLHLITPHQQRTHIQRLPRHPICTSHTSTRAIPPHTRRGSQDRRQGRCQTIAKKVAKKAAKKVAQKGAQKAGQKFVQKAGKKAMKAGRQQAVDNGMQQVTQRRSLTVRDLELLEFLLAEGELA